MELVVYEETYRDEMAQMLTSFGIWHQKLLKKEYDYEKMLEESYEMIPELNEGKHRLFLSMENDAIIGFIVLDYRGSEVCWIDDLFVKEEKRNQGYGSQMILKASDLVKSQGYEAISIDVVPRNTNAIKLYLNLGFDALSMLTLRHDFEDSYRNQSLDLLGFSFKY